MSISLNKFNFSSREKEILAPFVEKVQDSLNKLQAESRNHEATRQFTTEVLGELKPLAQNLAAKGGETVMIPDRAIYWILEQIDQQIHILNSIMPNTTLLDPGRIQFKGTGNAVLWELLQMHFKLSVHVIKRINALEGFPGRQ